MRIAIFSATYRPRLGGITVSVINTVNALRSVGIETTLFAPSPPANGVEAGSHFFPTIRWPLGGTIIRTAMPYSHRINSEFAKCRAELVHSFDPLFVGHAARRLARRHGLKSVLTYQTHYTDYVHFWPFGATLAKGQRLKSLVKAGITSGARNVCNSFDCVIVPTSATAQSLVQMGVTARIDIIPVGFDLAELSKNNLNVRRQLGLPLNAKVFLHLGRISPEKNIAFLINAFASALKASDQELYLIVAGDGPERGSLERQVHSLGVDRRVFFVGPVERRLVGSYFSAADAFLFSSLTETQGFVICESLMCGVPVIAIRANGPSDFVTAGEDGLLTDYNESAYASAIISFVGDDGLQRKLMTGARLKATLFGKQRYADSLLQLYSKLVG
jgi:1,2-diacylglycerol 3-alpha-glucosyltransferase